MYRIHFVFGLQNIFSTRSKINLKTEISSFNIASASEQSKLRIYEPPDIMEIGPYKWH